MQQISVFLKLGLAVLVSHPGGALLADAAETLPKLVGIVALPNLKRALLEVEPPVNARRYLLLGEGQREARIEVAQINPAQPSVRINYYAQAGVLSHTLTNLALPPGSGLCLDAVKLDPVLQLYGQLTNRTLLRSTMLPEVSLTLNAATTNCAAAAQALQSALAEKGISSVPDGNRFLMVVPKAEAATVKPRAAGIKSAAVTGAEGEMLAPGMIDFRNADARQVLDIYALLVGRKLQRTEFRSNSLANTITLVTQTPVTKEEAIYALETVLEWSGLQLVREGEEGLKVVPVPDNRR